MNRHEFKPRSVNPLTCETCKGVKAAPEHAIKPKMVTVSFQIPQDIYDELSTRAKNTGDAPSALARKVVIKQLGYEWSPPRPKQIIPAQPGRYVKKGIGS